MKKMHPTQQKILDFLKNHLDEGVTVRELQQVLDVSSPSVVHHHLKQLQKKGHLEQNPYNSGDYHIVAESPQTITHLNVYGLAQCGPNGLLLDGNPEDRIAIDTQLLSFPEHDAFLVYARGDSMTPRIQDGDIVIAQKSSFAQTGDIVVCSLESEAMIKKIQIKAEHFVLQSLNTKYQPIKIASHQSDSFKLDGIVRGVISVF